ncbi:PREDICTED: uncharacterized protein LOC105359329 [Ceratosolen solmsi marchali]|uniref:Uncharacterized protein LOC105359329 n=1 Tax=Ceratosolen solmsi marchali TaxID=326594 RepID=A0AAJ6YBD9_9HYME|nr:PREDICTED: uncharacterized protein LOC105359329 [Ceratosolen solmsi marchali]
MAGALSESAPRPVSVVRVDGAESSDLEQTKGAQESPAVESSVQLQITGESNTHTNPISVNGQQSDCQVRSFASTEAQTDVAPQLLQPPSAPFSSHAELLSEELRDARRRERRMRRHHRRAIQRVNGAAAAAAAAAVVNGACASLPPTYPSLMGTASGGIAGPSCGGGTATTPQNGASNGLPLVGPGGPVGGFLHPPPPHLGLRGLSLGLPFPVPASVTAFGRGVVPKQCCGLGSPPVRWSILGVGVVGLVCAGAGALLGALRATGRDHIAVALLMIGIGVVLVTVSAVAWRVTSRENCGGFFGLTGISGRIPPARPMHPYAAMIYPEFQFRTPPPSYQASMQEYRLRLLLLDRLQPTSSPPPTYRSNTGSCVATGRVSNGAPTTTAGALQVTGPRENQPPNYCGHRVTNTSQAHQSCSLVVPSKKDANLVRIVQTESEPVILSGDQTPPVTAVEVLAHL